MTLDDLTSEHRSALALLAGAGPRGIPEPEIVTAHGVAEYWRGVRWRGDRGERALGGVRADHGRRARGAGIKPLTRRLQLDADGYAIDHGGCSPLSHSAEPVACTPASGWEKGQVENQVGLVRERFFTPRLRFKTYDELNAWLLDQCIAYAKAHRHPELTDQTIWDVFEAERPKLVPYTGPFDGFHAVPASVSKTCLVRTTTTNTRWRRAPSVGRETIRVNSLHGQGIFELGERVVVEGVAEDGTIEAIRIADAPGFALGVQWHAEYDPQRNSVNGALFQAFGEALSARKRAA